MVTQLANHIAGAARPSTGSASLQDLNPSDERDIVAEVPTQRS